MQLHATISKTFLYGTLYHLCLSFAFTVSDGIICISLKRYGRVIPHHPFIERIMQEEVRK
jgi:hypothetical protein